MRRKHSSPALNSTMVTEFGVGYPQSMVGKFRKRESGRRRDPLFDTSDLEDQLLAGKSSTLWLGRYSRRKIMESFEHHGILGHLRGLGYHDARLALSQVEPFRQSLRLYEGMDDPAHLLMELRVHDGTLRPATRLEDGLGERLPRVLTIDWLTMQRPGGRFTTRRPPFPGQDHPGLGMARPLMRMLLALANSMELEGIVNHPNYYHNAWLYREGFRFYDPMDQARMKAIHRDLAGLSPVEIAWAVELGCVRALATDRWFSWESGLQILPISRRMKDFIDSENHRRQTAELFKEKHYTLDEDCFRLLYKERIERFRGRIDEPAADSREPAVPEPGGGPMSYASIHEMFRSVCEANPDKVAYRRKMAGEWISVTWKEQSATCDRVSRALMALGLNRGDRVCVLSNTRLEWVQADFGINSPGFVTVGIYPSNLAEDCAYIIEHCGGRAIFVENTDQLDKLMTVRDRTDTLEHYIMFDGPSNRSRNVLSWDDFLALADEVEAERFHTMASAVARDDLAALVYTSGTTGNPKGVMLSHGNLLFASDSVSEALPIEDYFETLLFLPLAHVFARLIAYVCVRNALPLAFAEGIPQVGENLKEIRPHFIASVPRIFEKVYDKITSGVQEAGGVKEKLFNWAIGVGMEAGKYRQAGKPLPGMLGFKHKLANKLVFAKIHAALGGRLQWAISGAAPLSKTIGEFFHACGILLLEGLGMTENTSFSNVNRSDHYKFGTVGKVGPGIEMKLAEDGEILFRGEHVMQGYYRSAEATAEAIDSDGWLYTGDIGEIDDEGFLKITDRKKDLIITAGGKNIAPQRVEQALKLSKYINQIVAYGDRRKYLTALVTLEVENVKAWAAESGLSYGDPSELCTRPEVQELVEAEIESFNRNLASFETVKKIRILPGEFTVESGELTPSLKIKRKVVLGNYQALLDEMYTD
ncbi:MAG: long-chain fatty acid--CoA ligase [Acidobacteria bacterium]|uniref:Long-chain fatty acid--CoA ligase n=1 Tax=Candidatus Polarisedimenticola svalbardensis TaxID=2886004 RepID=A0A8J6Y6L3_9BACT|nr:long-chain fatty acid--CoA ligase [Candidatus Polarisedimenticola svalbardensis]